MPNIMHTMQRLCYRRFIADLRKNTDGYSVKKSEVTCPECNAGYRRIELSSKPGSKGAFRCLVCDRLLEVFDGTKDVALRLTVQPEKWFEKR